MEPGETLEVAVGEKARLGVAEKLIRIPTRGAPHIRKLGAGMGYSVGR